MSSHGRSSSAIESLTPFPKAIPMKKLAVLLLLASMCACVHSQVKVTGSASVSGTAAINANSNITVSSLVITPANQNRECWAGGRLYGDGDVFRWHDHQRHQLRELVIVQSGGRRECGTNFS
jgi:hypothetical protein